MALQPSFFKAKMAQKEIPGRNDHSAGEVPKPDFGREEARNLSMLRHLDGPNTIVSVPDTTEPQLPPIRPDKVQDPLLRAALVGRQTLSFSPGPDDEESAPGQPPDPSGNPPKSRSNPRSSLDAAGSSKS